LVLLAKLALPSIGLNVAAKFNPNFGYLRLNLVAKFSPNFIGLNLAAKLSPTPSGHNCPHFMPIDWTGIGYHC